MQGASWVVLHATPLASIVPMQQASWQQVGGPVMPSSDQLVFGSDIPSTEWANAFVGLLFRADPLQITRRVESNCIHSDFYGPCYSIEGQGHKRDTIVPRRRDAGCNLDLRRFRTGGGSRRYQLPHLAHRCCNVLPTYPSVCARSSMSSRHRVWRLATPRSYIPQMCVKNWTPGVNVFKSQQRRVRKPQTTLRRRSTGQWSWSTGLQAKDILPHPNSRSHHYCDPTTRLHAVSIKRTGYM